MSEAERKNFRSVLKAFFFLDAGTDANVIRAQMESSLDLLRRKKASRAGTQSLEGSEYKGLSFPSGIPFDNTTQK
jgi:hypothetical protein